MTPFRKELFAVQASFCSSSFYSNSFGSSFGSSSFSSSFGSSFALFLSACIESEIVSLTKYCCNQIYAIQIWAMQRKIRGRGAALNPSGRFEKYSRQPCLEDDSGSESSQEGANEGRKENRENREESKVATQVSYEQAKQLINRHNSPDLPFRATINPYRGCEHGCIYCYARPYHAYIGLSSGLDFETKIFAKVNAAEALTAQLSRSGYKVETVVIGASTDPYQPTERKLGITRSILEVLWEHRHPVSIITKSALILRDLDIIAKMASRKLIAISISVTTLNEKLANIMEPRGSTPSLRLKTLQQLSERGVPTTVMFAPLIPALNDMEMEQVLSAAAQHGARAASYTMLRLPYEVKELFEDWLERHFPEKADHVLKLLRGCHGGKVYNWQWNLRRKGMGSYAAMIQRRFALARRRLQLDRWHFNLDDSQFRHDHRDYRTDRSPQLRAKRSKSRAQDSLQYNLALPLAEE